MAKLQKERRSAAPHHSRHSTVDQPRVDAVRLTPAQIRAQNNGEAARAQTQLVPKQSTEQRSEGHVTPPPSPTKSMKEPSAYQTQLARTASKSQRPPTPPRSPRLSSVRTVSTRQNAMPVAQHMVSQYRQSMPIEAYRGIVGTPLPTSSRTSSISGSIKTPMKYRGHEITRTGSISMFQAPQPDIVMNPLSNFSRPRNKYSPPGSFNRQDGNDLGYQAQHRRTYTADSAVSSLQSRSESPVMRCESPVSARSGGGRASRQFTIVTEDSLPMEDEKKGRATKLRALTPDDEPGLETPPLGDMKKTASFNLDKAVDANVETEKKKKRRHTFSWKRSSAVELKAGLKKDLEIRREEPVVAEAENSQNTEQPAAEETISPTALDKGKGKEVVRDHPPQVIGIKCCDKCGRIKKLQDGRALINDGTVTEALVVAGPSSYKLIKTSDDLTSMSSVNPAGAANAAQLIMHRQRRPRPEPPAALPNDHVVKDFAPMSEQDEPVAHKTSLEPPIRITRFASLHGISHEKEIATSLPALDTNLESSQLESEPQMKATSTPIDEPLPEFIFDPADEDDNFDLAPPQPRRYSFESQRSVLNVAVPERPFETQKSAPEVVPKAIEPIDLSKPLVLPQPNFGLHFARSNLTLRGLVMPKGGSSSNLLADALMASENTDEVERGLRQSDQMDQQRQKHQSRVSEIMAV